MSSRRRRYEDEEEEEEEEEDFGRDDYEDDGFLVRTEDEEEDEEEYVSSSRAKKKKKTTRNMFIDDAAVDSEGDDDYDEEEEGEEGFIDNSVEQHTSSRPSQYIRQPILEEEESAEVIAARLTKKYSSANETFRTGGSGGSGLSPTANDPNLYMAKCKLGKEKIILKAIMEKVFRSARTPTPIQIETAFYRENLKGFIYIESYKLNHVQKAIERVTDLYGGKITLVPRKEMAEVLEIKAKEETLKEKDWVRIKRGKYMGDLAQVLRIADDEGVARVRLIPRIDLTPRSEHEFDATGKRKKNDNPKDRPPKKFFNRKEVELASGVRGAVIKRRGYFVYGNENYKDGFLEKDLKIATLTTSGVNPSLDEVTLFASAFEDEEEKANILESLTTPLSSKRLTAQVKTGDTVEILEGSMSTIVGTLVKIDGDVAIIRPQIKGYGDLSFPLHKVRKHYKEGDHVKVANGKYEGESGFIVKISDNVVTVISDASTSEIQVFTKDLVDGGSTSFVQPTNSKFNILDFVELDAHNIGVIIKTERDSFKVMDQNGIIKNLPATHARPVSGHTRAIAVDSKRNPLQIGDQVKTIHGDSRHGTILHIHKNTAFIKSREILENAGMSVEKCHFLASQSGHIPLGSGKIPGVNPNGLVVPRNPPNNFRGRGGSFGGRGRGRGRGRRDPMLDKTVNIRSGPYKGYIGIVKEVIENSARIELHTNSRIVTVDKSIIAFPGDPSAGSGGSYSGSFGNSAYAGPVSTVNPTTVANWGNNNAYNGQSRGFQSNSRFNNADKNQTAPWNPSRTPSSRPWNDGSQTGRSAFGQSRQPEAGWGANQAQSHYGGNETPSQFNKPSLPNSGAYIAPRYPPYNSSNPQESSDMPSNQSGSYAPKPYGQQASATSWEQPKSQSTQENSSWTTSQSGPAQGTNEGNFINWDKSSNSSSKAPGSWQNSQAAPKAPTGNWRDSQVTSKESLRSWQDPQTTNQKPASNWEPPSTETSTWEKRAGGTNSGHDPEAFVDDWQKHSNFNSNKDEEFKSSPSFKKPNDGWAGDVPTVPRAAQDAGGWAPGPRAQVSGDYNGSTSRTGSNTEPLASRGFKAPADPSAGEYMPVTPGGGQAFPATPGNAFPDTPGGLFNQPGADPYSSLAPLPRNTSPDYR